MSNDSQNGKHHEGDVAFIQSLAELGIGSPGGCEFGVQGALDRFEISGLHRVEQWFELENQRCETRAWNERQTALKGVEVGRLIQSSNEEGVKVECAQLGGTLRPLWRYGVGASGLVLPFTPPRPREALRQE